VFETVAPSAGKLDVTLATADPITLSVRSSCGDAASELSCSFPTRLTLDVEAEQRLYLVVGGAAEGGDFALEVHHRKRACGDGVRDAVADPDGRVAEECDDDNEVDGDGCDQNCRLESDEVDGDNDSPATADVVLSGLPKVAQILPELDVDYYTVELTAASSKLVVETSNLGDGACLHNLQDTLVEVFDDAAESVAAIAVDDDGGEGRCSGAVLPGLPSGTYTIAVSAAAEAQPQTFPYVLFVDVEECGDGHQGVGEQCDDGNTEGGDGCNADCSLQ
jgi:cysteine-rich repeat protein